MKLLIIMSLLCLMAACGGGGDSGGDDSGGSVSPETTPDSGTDSDPVATPDSGIDSDPVATQNTVSMEELAIPDGFSFNNLETINLTVDLAEFADERSFISLYTEYNSETMKPVYRSKIITAELIDGKASVSFTINNSELPIIAEAYGLNSRTSSQQLIDLTAQNASWIE